MNHIEPPCLFLWECLHWVLQLRSVVAVTLWGSWHLHHWSSCPWSREEGQSGGAKQLSWPMHFLRPSGNRANQTVRKHECQKAADEIEVLHTLQPHSPRMLRNTHSQTYIPSLPFLYQGQDSTDTSRYLQCHMAAKAQTAEAIPLSDSTYTFELVWREQGYCDLLRCKGPSLWKSWRRARAATCSNQMQPQWNFFPLL